MPPKNEPLFSLIVPAYNVEAYIAQCIESILTQDCSNFELILVDDGSTDRTGQICEQYKKQSPQLSIISQNREKVNSKIASPSIKVLHQLNSGLSAARNTGVAESSGKYLIFIDGDDYLEPGALTAIQNALEPTLDLLRYQAQEVFPDGKKIRYEEASFATLSGVEAFKRLVHNHYTENAWLYAYRRQFFVSNHFQYATGCIAEDFGLTPLIIACASTVKSIPDICYNYRQREGSITHDTTQIARRTTDAIQQLQDILPKIAAIPHAEPILHYLVVSYLTGATELSYPYFLQVYQESKQNGLLRYIHPSSPKALPRAFLLKHFPGLFYRMYHH